MFAAMIAWFRRHAQSGCAIGRKPAIFRRSPKARLRLMIVRILAHDWYGPGQAPRRTASWRWAATETAASRAATASSAVSVRSGARKVSLYASDFRPAPT